MIYFWFKEKLYNEYLKYYSNTISVFNLSAQIEAHNAQRNAPLKLPCQARSSLCSYFLWGACIDEWINVHFQKRTLQKSFFKSLHLCLTFFYLIAYSVHFVEIDFSSVFFAFWSKQKACTFMLHLYNIEILTAFLCQNFKKSNQPRSNLKIILFKNLLILAEFLFTMRQNLS